MTKPLGRRTLLRGAGGVGIALPFLDAMGLPARRAAGPASAPLFMMVGQNGVVPGAWFPTGPETRLHAGLVDGPVRAAQENLIILDGIRKMQRRTADGTAHGRGSAGAFTGHTTSGKNGIADGPSIDQADRQRHRRGHPYQVADAAARSTNYHFLHSGPAGAFAEPRPGQDFDRLFTGFTPPSPGPGAAPGPNLDLEKLRARKKSILDDALERVQQGRRPVGPGDSRRLDVHAEAIRQVELQHRQRGDHPGGGHRRLRQAGCPPRSPSAADYQMASKANLELITLAFACDATRVAGRQYTSHGQIFNWLGVGEKHHPLAHQTGNAGADAQLAKIVAWHAGSAAACCRR